MTMTNLETARYLANKAYALYLDNWETKTQVAENDGVWTKEIQIRILENSERMASTLQALAHNLGDVAEALNAHNIKTDKPA